MQTKVQKWGNSLGVRIPKALAEEAGVEAGAEVDLAVSNGDLILRPRRRTRYRLADLLRQVTAENIHEEIDTGPAVGREVW